MTAPDNGFTDLSISVIKTGTTATREGLTYAGGSLFKLARINYVAVLVRHKKEMFLFDTGLGNSIDAQYRADMPKWKQLFLHYSYLASAEQQLKTSKLPPISRIFLSHGHWDHASGVVDFPNAEVWVSDKEKVFLDETLASKKLFGPAVLPSQIDSQSIRWHPFSFKPDTFLGFTESYDIFDDGSAVLVPLPGHTPGSVGLVVTLPSKQRLFFCGDVVWNAKALDQKRPKPWLARFITDQDQAALHRTIEQLAAIRVKHPEVTIIPAHDASSQDPFGYYPTFYQSG